MVAHLRSTTDCSPGSRRPALLFIDQEGYTPWSDTSCCDPTRLDKCPLSTLSWSRVRASGELKKLPQDIGNDAATHTIAITLMD